jgi:hypothetical protein
MTKSPNPIFVLAFLMGGEMPIFDQSGSIQKKTSGSRAAFLGDQKLKNFLLLQRALKELRNRWLKGRSQTAGVF